MRSVGTLLVSIFISTKPAHSKFAPDNIAFAFYSPEISFSLAALRSSNAFKIKSHLACKSAVVYTLLASSSYFIPKVDLDVYNASSFSALIPSA